MTLLIETKTHTTWDLNPTSPQMVRQNITYQLMTTGFLTHQKYTLNVYPSQTPNFQGFFVWELASPGQANKCSKEGTVIGNPLLVTKIWRHFIRPWAMIIIEIKQNQGSSCNTLMEYTSNYSSGPWTANSKKSCLNFNSGAPKCFLKRKGDTITSGQFSGQYILIPTLTVIALHGRYIPMIHPQGSSQIRSPKPSPPRIATSLHRS